MFVDEWRMNRGDVFVDESRMNRGWTVGEILTFEKGLHQREEEGRWINYSREREREDQCVEIDHGTGSVAEVPPKFQSKRFHQNFSRRSGVSMEEVPPGGILRQCLRENQSMMNRGCVRGWIDGMCSWMDRGDEFEDESRGCVRG